MAVSERQLYRNNLNGIHEMKGEIDVAVVGITPDTLVRVTAHFQRRL
jgi:hypothetical protein